jgi:glutaminyl-peptide cyclotransferase
VRRHLAHKWSESYLPPTHPVALKARRYDPTPSILETIDVFVLLDLLGHKSPRIHSYYRETDWLHLLMSEADERLREAGLVDVESGEEGWFSPTHMGPGMIGDDHVPVRRAVAFGDLTDASSSMLVE